jgi:hypothetical protein
MDGLQHGLGGGGPGKIVAQARKKKWVGRFLHPIGSHPAWETSMESVRTGLGLGVIATIILEMIKILSIFTR